MQRLVRRVTLVAACLVFAAVGATASEPAAAPADLVLTGGEVYTVDAARSWAEAVAIRGGRIVWVGSDDGAKAWIGPATRVVALGGRFVMPGFHDSHLHPITGGMRTLQCELSGAATAAEALERVQAYAAAHPERPWIVGRGWELPLFPAANPRKELLDAVVSDRPVYLTAADGHTAWVNSKALALAGVTAATPDPPSGRIERDPATGEPSGYLREDAKALVSRLLPETTQAERAEGLARTVELAHRAGLVGLFDASVDAIELPVYRDLDRAGQARPAHRHRDVRRPREAVRAAARRARRAARAGLGPARAPAIGEAVRRRRHRVGDGGSARPVPRPRRRPRRPRVGRGEARRGGDRPRPRRVPAPRPRDRRSRHPRDARRRGGGAPRQRPARPAADAGAHRAVRPRRRAALPRARRHRLVPAAVGVGRPVHPRPHRAAARPRTVALALPDRAASPRPARSSPAAATGR